MKIIKKFKNKITSYKIFFKSKYYWETRYKTGGNSGSGSYNEIAKYKANIINEFISKNEIRTIIDLGCGDGNQIRYLNVSNYFGFDVSKTAIEICKKKYTIDKSKRFYLFKNKIFQQIVTEYKPELSLSLDVIYHLVEDKIFENYINDLFDGASKYVIIFSTNNDKYQEAIHHRNRKFEDYINKNILGWHLYRFIENKYKGENSSADFYIYKREIK